MLTALEKQLVGVRRQSAMNWGLIAVLVGVFATGFLLSRAPGENLYLLQAQAWLRGTWALDVPAHDVAIVGGRAMVPFPPFPSVLLLPWALAGGAHGIASKITSSVLAVLAAALVFRIVRREGASPIVERAMVTAMLMGTCFWSAVLWSNGVWFFAHVVAFTASLLALDEAGGRARGPLLGAWLGVAFLSRQLALYGLPVLLAVLWVRRGAINPRSRSAHLLGATATFGVCVGLYLVINQLRFGNPLETGYSAIPLDGHLAARVSRYGLFNVAYVPFNAIYMFFQGPSFVFAGDRMLRPVGLDAMGTSLTFASPFVFLALLGPNRDWVRAGSLVSAGLALGHMLLYYNNGWVQLGGQRFTLDFLPWLLPLIARGAVRVGRRATVALAAWSVGWNVFAIVALPMISRLLRSI